MTYQQNGDFVLGDKLKREFSDRGRDLHGMRASSTPELMKRAARGNDPRVNCSEEAFRENYREFTETRSYASQNTYAQRRPSAGYSHSSGRGRAQQGRARTENAREAGRAQNKSSSRAESTAYSGRAKQRERITPSAELRVKSRFLSPAFVLSLLAGTVMIMFLVFNISEVYSATNRVSALESQLEELEATADGLELRLEEKNDIREIEKIATSKLGMVKEDALQRRYVTLSEGEYIKVLETEEEESRGGVLLSSIFSSLGELFDRFK